MAGTSKSSTAPSSVSKTDSKKTPAPKSSKTEGGAKVQNPATEVPQSAKTEKLARAKLSSKKLPSDSAKGEEKSRRSETPKKGGDHSGQTHNSREKESAPARRSESRSSSRTEKPSEKVKSKPSKGFVFTDVPTDVTQSKDSAPQKKEGRSEKPPLAGEKRKMSQEKEAGLKSSGGDVQRQSEHEKKTSSKTSGEANKKTVDSEKRSDSRTSEVEPRRRRLVKASEVQKSKTIDTQKGDDSVSGKSDHERPMAEGEPKSKKAKKSGDAEESVSKNLGADKIVKKSSVAKKVSPVEKEVSVTEAVQSEAEAVAKNTEKETVVNQSGAEKQSEKESDLPPVEEVNQMIGDSLQKIRHEEGLGTDAEVIEKEVGDVPPVGEEEKSDKDDDRESPVGEETEKGDDEAVSESAHDGEEGSPAGDRQDVEGSEEPDNDEEELKDGEEEVDSPKSDEAEPVGEPEAANTEDVMQDVDDTAELLKETDPTETQEQAQDDEHDTESKSDESEADKVDEVMEEVPESEESPINAQPISVAAPKGTPKSHKKRLEALLKKDNIGSRLVTNKRGSGLPFTKELVEQSKIARRDLSENWNEEAPAQLVKGKAAVKVSAPLPKGASKQKASVGAPYAGIRIREGGFPVNVSKQRWDVVQGRKVVAEEVLDENKFQVQEVIDLVKRSGLYQSVTQAKPFDEQLVREVIANVTEEFGNEYSADYGLVKVRGHEIMLSEEDFNNYYGIEECDDTIVIKDFNKLAERMTNGKVTDWSKSTIKSINLTTKFALLHGICLRNWIPMLHRDSIHRKVGGFIWNVSQGLKPNLGKKVFEHIADHASSKASPQPIAYPSAIYEVVTAKCPELLEGSFMKLTPPPKKFAADWKVFVGTRHQGHTVDVKIPDSIRKVLEGKKNDAASTPSAANAMKQQTLSFLKDRLRQMHDLGEQIKAEKRELKEMIKFLDEGTYEEESGEGDSGEGSDEEASD